MFEFGGSFQELLLIFVVALLVVGPKRLPEVGRMLARAMRELRRASDEVRSTIETNLNLDAPAPGPSSPEPAPSEPSSPTAAEVTPSVLSTPETEPDTAGGLSAEPYLAQMPKHRVSADALHVSILDRRVSNSQRRLLDQ